MSRPVAVAIVRELEDGTLEATVLQSNEVGNKAGLFLYSMFRETRRKNAPPFFTFGTLTSGMKSTLTRWRNEMVGPQVTGGRT